MPGNNYYGDMDKDFNFMLRILVGIQANFELGDEDTIEEYGSVEEYGNTDEYRNAWEYGNEENYGSVDKSCRFVVGHMRYRVVIVPNLPVLRQKTVELLEKFSRAGGRLIIMGKLPGMVDGKPDNNLAEKLLSLKGTICS
jgi:hypothetical protein